MIDTLYSDSWYRVADLRPRLRSHAQIHRHVYRGEVWYVLQDHASGRFHRFNLVSNALIGLMDGSRTMQQIWDFAMERLGKDAPPQDEVIKLLSDLHRADVLQTDTAPDLHELEQRRRTQWRMKVMQYVSNPMSLRIPLHDPDRWLDRAVPYLRWMTGPAGIVLWLAVVGYGLALGVGHWREFSNGMFDKLFIFHNLVLMWFLFPLVKTLHELGHAVTTKIGGGEVHEMGIMFLVLMPIPYVDASSASAFRSKRVRMLTGLAGMMVELFLAALALMAWVHLGPGIERATVYDIVLITGLSTIIFNGNPLLRYDGYYVLSDYLEIPNLAQRANEYVGYLGNRYILGIDTAEPPHLAKGERFWFVFYALTSFVYRMFVTFTIVLLIASRFFIVGILIAIWSLYAMLLYPAFSKLSQMVASHALGAKRWLVLGRAVGVALAVLFVLFVLPLPSSTEVQGVTWAPKDAQVRTAEDCLVTRLVARPMSQVHKGDVLFECENMELMAKERLVQGEYDELAARHAAALPESRLQASILQQQIDEAREALAVSHARIASLVVRSRSDGTFILDTPEDLVGKYFQRGELVGYVMDKASSSVRVVVPQSAEEVVNTKTKRIEIRPEYEPGHRIVAHIAREVPAATNELPSMTLSLQGGGDIGLDPSRPSDNRSIEPLFVVDLDLPAGVHLPYLGSRIYVRFVYAPEPLAERLYHGLRRLVLQRFNV